ncbi:MAG: UvrD-helicase domain-containing protein [Acidimicrobiia bacterium]
MTTPTVFDPRQRLAAGTTILEAGAGTGKTHAVASLVVAEVAEGRPLDEMLVVTFTRKAAGTLRDRVWRRLAETADALRSDGGDRADELLGHLSRGGELAVADRRRHLDRALSNFDAATIATTHGFCQQVLAAIGVAGDAERDLEVVEDIDDLLRDAVDDLFVRRFHAGGDVLFDRSAAMTIARAVISKPDCLIAPVDDIPAERLRHQFATTLRQRILDQKRRARLITYDDLLSRLEASVIHDERGEIVLHRLRRRFSMAVVDEFQDTDSVQWRILQRAFGLPPCRLVLVGDPKQAIYAFRGGDIHTYLDATTSADHRRSLEVSWRADQALLDGLDAFFAGARLGHRLSAYRRLRARPGAEDRRLQGPKVGAPMTVRVVGLSPGPSTAGAANRRPARASTRELIARDLAVTAARILAAGSTIVERDAHGVAVGRPRAVHPGDLAVLTRTHGGANAVRGALVGAGLPAVVHGGASVFATDAAGHWLDLLRALEQPASQSRVRAVALGPFVGWDAARVAGAADDDWEEVDGKLHDWAAALRSHGAAGLLRRIESTAAVGARLLATVGGERQLSDLRHLAELVHGRQAEHPGSMATLIAWLGRQQRDNLDVPGGEAVRRRLESDAAAVGVHTVHGAKGLEFPIVLLPSLWDVPWRRDDEPAVFHDSDGRRALAVGRAGPLRDQQAALAADERAEEELRLLYVALTRARHQVVAWWAPHDGRTNALSRVLLGCHPATGQVARRLATTPGTGEIADALRGRGIAVEPAGGADDRRYEVPASSAAPLSVRAFDRSFDRHWARTSYSALTRVAHDAGAGGGDRAGAPEAAETVEVDERAKVDEPSVDAGAVGPAESDLLAVTLVLADMPGGARVGTLVHDILERTDFASTDLVAALAAAAAEAGARRVVEGHVDTLVAGLVAAIETPLGPAWGGTGLRSLRRADRLDELAFDLPLAGGEAPAGLVTMTGIADLFAGLPARDPLAGYHERLRASEMAMSVRGFLTGSIDLVARVAGRHLVVDYKTNHLAPPGEAVRAWHYRPDALVGAMYDAHYPLQAALYLVALHRFLRWRLPGYAPDRHLGGVAYLFLRGMTGPDGPMVAGRPCGVFAWHPPPGFVTDLSDLLDRGTS